MASELSRLIEDELKNKGYYVEDEDEKDVEAPHADDEHKALIGALRVEARVKEQNAQKHLLGLKRAVCIGGGIAIVCVVWIVLVVKSSGTSAPVQQDMRMDAPDRQPSNTDSAISSPSMQPALSPLPSPLLQPPSESIQTPAFPPPSPSPLPSIPASPPPTQTPALESPPPPTDFSPPPPKQEETAQPPSPSPLPPPPPPASPPPDQNTSPPLPPASPLTPGDDTSDDDEEDQDVADDGSSPPPPKFVQPPANTDGTDDGGLSDLLKYEDYVGLVGDEDENKLEPDDEEP